MIEKRLKSKIKLYCREKAIAMQFLTNGSGVSNIIMGRKADSPLILTFLFCRGNCRFRNERPIIHRS